MKLLSNLVHKCRIGSPLIYGAHLNTPALFQSQHLSAHAEKSSMQSLVGRNFLTLKDFSPAEIKQMLWVGMDLKHRLKVQQEVYRPLEGKSLAMIFEKRSTRTRMSTETAFGLLGGQALFLSSDDIHLGVNESLVDTSRVMSRFVDMILARVYSHQTLQTLVSEGSIPIVSGLCDIYHPLQILADFITLQEHFGQLRDLTVSWVGDGNNNVTHSFMMGCPLVGINLRIAAPAGYEVDPKVAADAKIMCEKYGTTIEYTNDPKEAVRGGDVIVADTFVSMGMENEKEQRLKDFDGFQVTRELCNLAKDSCVFMHCLPRKPEDVTDEVFYDKKRSLVWDEAENRKWSVMSVMLLLLKDHIPATPQPNF